jgi:tRNA modification GTPase
MTDTIFALATPPGRSGVAVIRISGPATSTSLSALTDQALPQPRMASLRTLKALSGETIDEALVLRFVAPSSFTGEDSAELQIHGGPAVIEAVSTRLLELGLRPAGPGEFTRRAFQNGKLDLTEAEGLADLIDAETEAQRQQALAQLTGSLRNLYESWRERLISILAALEGEIDFPDEDDVPDHLGQVAGEPLRQLVSALESHLQDGNRGERIRDGFSIALIGEPNAGKSSLINRLAKREAAIVTEIPGTTRDIVEVRLVLDGYAVIIADTAGLRETSDRVEIEGVKRARRRAETADLRLGVVDVSRETGLTVNPFLKPGDAIIANKIDLSLDGMKAPSESDFAVFPISAKSGEGIDTLQSWLAQTVSERLAAQESPALSRARHRSAVTVALDHLRQAQGLIASAPEIAAAEIHLSVRALASLTGNVDVEDVLDQVFSQFCIGK